MDIKINFASQTIMWLVAQKLKIIVIVYSCIEMRK